MFSFAGNLRKTPTVLPYFVSPLKTRETFSPVKINRVDNPIFLIAPLESDPKRTQQNMISDYSRIYKGPRFKKSRNLATLKLQPEHFLRFVIVRSEVGFCELSTLSVYISFKSSSIYLLNHGRGGRHLTR